MAALKSANIA